MNKLSPNVLEFGAKEDAAAYDAWLRAKAEASLADPRPPGPNDEAMARIEKFLAEKQPARGNLA